MPLMNLLSIDSPELDEILEDISDAGGEITPEQERKLYDMQKDATGVLHQAKKVLELKERMETSKLWRDQQRGREKIWESIMVLLKEHIPTAMLKHKMQSPLRDEFGVISVSLISPRTGVNRRLELHDTALENEYSPSGCYKDEQVQESTIPRSYFDKVVVWKPNKDRIRKQLNAGLNVGFAKLESQYGVRIGSPKPKKEKEEPASRGNSGRGQRKTEQKDRQEA